MENNPRNNRVIKCRKCKEKFRVVGNLGELCPKCIFEEETLFREVRSYVRDRPGISINDVSDDLKVSKAKIMTYIREQRIQVINRNALILTCKNCGKVIPSGVFCQECLKFGKIK